MIRVRYIVHDVDEAVAFYTSNLDFQLVEQFGPAIAILERDELAATSLRTQGFSLDTHA